MTLACVYSVLIVFFFDIGQNLPVIGAIAGHLFGILIERGQICFTSAFRDMWISGRAVMSKAIAVGMMVSVVFTFIYIQTSAAQVIEVAAPSTVIGGLLLEFGIVLAGGCETGMMYRAMEGQYKAQLANLLIGPFVPLSQSIVGLSLEKVGNWKQKKSFKKHTQNQSKPLNFHIKNHTPPQNLYLNEALFVQQK